MDTVQIVIVTILVIAEATTLAAWVARAMDLDDSLWIEPVVMVVLGLLIYLVVR